MIQFEALTGEQLLALARRMKVMRFVNDVAICLRCNDPIAWVVAHPLTLEVRYVDASTPGARPLTLCARHRDIESGRVFQPEANQ